MTDNGNDLTIPVGDSDHLQGNPNAAIVLLEYGDFECPHCRRAYPIIQKIQRHFKDDLCFVFRSFPLTQSHPHAEHAAEAAEAADQHGKFWEYHDRLYENQHALDDASLSIYADELGIPVEQFDEAIATGAFKDMVQQSFMSGVESGVNGTPSFFVNGSRYDGSWDYEDFSAYLNSLR